MLHPLGALDKQRNNNPSAWSSAVATADTLNTKPQLATTAVAKIRGNTTVSFGTASCRSNLEWYSTCPNFMSNVDPGKWWSFVEAWIVSFEKGSFAWKEAVIAQSRNLDVQSFSNSLLWARSWQFFVLSGLENPCFGNLENPLTNSCTNATYQIQNKPILFGVPARDVRNELHLCPTKTPNAISCGLGPSFPSRCTNFQLLTHHLSYHQEFKKIVWHLRSTFYVRLLWPLQKVSQLPTLNSNFSQNSWGKQHKCSKDNLGHSLHYQLEKSSHLWLWNHTSETCPGVLFSHTWHPLSLLRKTAETEAAPSSFLNHWTSQPRKTQRHGLKKMVQFFVLGNAAIDTANFRNASGPCVDFCVHVLDSYLCNLKVVFN